MDKDKSQIQFLGQPLLARIVERFSSLAEEIIITTNDPQKLSYLGLSLYKDILLGNGALGGLYTALYYASHPYVAVVACDMPFASPSLVAAAMEIMKSSGTDVVIPSGPNGLEPMHAVYRRTACLPAVKHALEHGERRLIAWFPEVSVYEMSRDETALYDPGFRAFVNINTADDLARAQEMEQDKGR